MDTFKPTSHENLRKLINRLIKERGVNADLNDIDTSLITDMFYLFHNSDFNGNISKWDVSNIKDMSDMFRRSKFKGNISDWNVLNVISMRFMFAVCSLIIKLESDLNKRGVNKALCVHHMFMNLLIKD